VHKGENLMRRARRFRENPASKTIENPPDNCFCRSTLCMPPLLRPLLTLLLQLLQ
jgi:hypothetical protein